MGKKKHQEITVMEAPGGQGVGMGGHGYQQHRLGHHLRRQPRNGAAGRAPAEAVSPPPHPPTPVDKQIKTGPFLEAVSHPPPFFHCLGSPMFIPIKADISGIKPLLHPGLPSEHLWWGAGQEPPQLPPHQCPQGLWDGPHEVRRLDRAEDLPHSDVCGTLYVWLPKSTLHRPECDRGGVPGEDRLFLVNYSAVIDEMYTNITPKSTTRCRCAPCEHDCVTRPPTCSHLQKQANLNHCELSGWSLACLQTLEWPRVWRGSAGDGSSFLKGISWIFPNRAINNDPASESPLNFTETQTDFIPSFRCGKNQFMLLIES